MQRQDMIAQRAKEAKGNNGEENYMHHKVVMPFFLSKKSQEKCNFSLEFKLLDSSALKFKLRLFFVPKMHLSLFTFSRPRLLDYSRLFS